MTIEEKARAYDKALKWMRELYPGLHGATKEDAEHYFPELRESEDELIRKSLVGYFEKFKPQDMWDERFSIGDVLAYLEKQKDHFRDDTKMVEKQDYSSLNDLERAIHRGFLSAGVENAPVTLIKETAKECLEQVKPSEINIRALLSADRLASAEMTGRLKERSEILENPEEYGLHKPSEWSEEDEKMIETICKEGDLKPSEQCWLKSLRPVKQEWSKKEERIMDNCIEYIKASCLDANDLYECIDWLKSLRPQPHWKPSEEQMRALADTLEDMPGHYKPKCTLESLERDLKKLL